MWISSLRRDLANTLRSISRRHYGEGSLALNIEKFYTSNLLTSRAVFSTCFAGGVTAARRASPSCVWCVHLTTMCALVLHFACSAASHAVPYMSVVFPRHSCHMPNSPLKQNFWSFAVGKNYFCSAHVRRKDSSKARVSKLQVNMSKNGREGEGAAASHHVWREWN